MDLLHFLRDAIRIHNNSEVIELLDLHPKLLDRPNSDGEPLLTMACRWGNLEIVNELLDRGSQAITIPNSNGYLPIHYAAAEGHSEILNRLIAAIPMVEGEDRTITIRNHLMIPAKDGMTPLAAALVRDNTLDGGILFDLAPEAIFVSSKMFQRAGTRMMPLFRRSVEKFGLSRILPLVVDSSTGQSAVFSMIKGGSEKEFSELLAIVSLKNLSLSELQLLVKILANVDAWPRFKIVFASMQLDSMLNPKLMAHILAESIRKQNEKIFNLVVDQSILDSEVFLNPKLTEYNRSLLRIAINAFHDPIIPRLISIYSELATDPFNAGRIYAHLFDKDNLFDDVINGRNVTVMELRTVAQITNRFGGPLAVGQAISQPSVALLYHLIESGSLEVIAFWMSLGGKVFELSVRPPGMSLKFQQALCAINIYPVGPGCPLSEDLILETRFRVYFKWSLLDRLIFHI